MSNYPGGLDIFADKTGADSISSSDPNNAFDSIEAIENFVGASGKPQSWNETMLSALRYYRRGMRVEVSGGVLYVRAGEASLVDTNGNITVLRRNPADVTLTAANLDAGTLAATFYYVYARSNGVASTAPLVYSTDINAPSGIGTHPYMKIGWLKNEAVGALSVTYAGSWRAYGDEPNCAQVINTYAGVITATNWIPCPSGPLTINMVTSGRPLSLRSHVVYNGYSALFFAIDIDGTKKCMALFNEGNAQNRTFSLNWLEQGLAPGAHVLQLMFNLSGGYLAGGTAPTVFSVEEL